MQLSTSLASPAASTSPTALSVPAVNAGVTAAAAPTATAGTASAEVPVQARAVPASATTASTTVNTGRELEAPSVAGSLASMTASLAVVLALVFGFAWLMRKLQGLRPARAGELRVEGGLQLGPKERVLILQAGDARLLLAVTSTQISLLHRLPDGEGGGTSASASPSFTPASGPFAEQLRKLFERNP